MKRNATKRLLGEMIKNELCVKYIKCGWYSLYLDIITYAGEPEILATLDSISIYALLDWYEFREDCEKGE